MTSYFKSLPVTAAALLLALTGYAQEKEGAVASTGAVRPIPTSDQMFKKTITRAIDLREKQNRPMFSDGKEISKVLIDAVKRGELVAYKNDSTTSTYTAKEMSGKMSYAIDAPVSVDEGGDWGGSGGSKPKPAGAAAGSDGWGAAAATTPARASTRVPRKDKNGKIMKDRQGRTMYTTVAATPAPPPPPPAPTTAEFRPKDIYQMEMTEEMIFDKKRSRMYHQIKTVSLKLPSTLPGNVGGLEQNIATFKYADIVKVFRNNPQTAIWFNEQNEAQNKNMADAFELWLFNSYIIKVSNPKNDDLAAQYGGDKQGLLAAQQTAADLIEYEYNLWSF